MLFWTSTLHNEYGLLRWNSFPGKSFRGRVKHRDLKHDAIRPFVISPDYLLVGNLESREEWEEGNTCVRPEDPDGGYGRARFDSLQGTKQSDVTGKDRDRLGCHFYRIMYII